MESSAFVSEGKMEIGSKEQFFVFLDGQHLGQMLVEHFRLPGEPGYCDAGRVRVTVERLDEPET